MRTPCRFSHFWMPNLSTLTRCCVGRVSRTGADLEFFHEGRCKRASESVRERPIARERHPGSMNGSIKFKVYTLGSIISRWLCRLSSGAIAIMLHLIHVLLSLSLSSRMVFDQVFLIGAAGFCRYLNYVRKSSHLFYPGRWTSRCRGVRGGLRDGECS